nr:hypothetical protein [Tanacetum cinerariifolium]
MQMVGGNGGNQFRQGAGHYAKNCTVMPKRRDAAYPQTQLLTAQKEEAGIQLQAEDDPVYDTDGSAEVHENCDDNEIFNMFTQEEQYTELLEPIPESHQVPQNDNDVISEDTNVEQAKVADYKYVQIENSLKRWKSKKTAKDNGPQAVLASGQGKQWEHRAAGGNLS